MFFGSPGTHVQSDFGDQSQCGGFIDAVNLCKVDAADAKRLLPKIEFRAIAWLLSSYSRGLQFALIGFRFETLQMFGDLSVTGLDLLLIAVVQLQALLQRK